MNVPAETLSTALLSAAATALRAQVLCWPVTDASFENASYNQFADGHFLTKNMMKWFWDAYTTDPRQRQEIYASPLLASPEQLRGLPPALVQATEELRARLSK